MALYLPDSTTDKGNWNEVGVSGGTSTPTPSLADAFAQCLDSSRDTYAKIVLDAGGSNAFQVRTRPDAAPNSACLTVSVQLEAKLQNLSTGDASPDCAGSLKVEVICGDRNVYCDTQPLAEGGEWQTPSFSPKEVELSQSDLEKPELRVTAIAQGAKYEFCVNNASLTIS